MKKHLRKISLILVSVIASASIASAQGYIVHDLTTGVVNGTTTPIAYGSADDTWKIALPSNLNSFFPAVVCSNLNGDWDVNSCGRWITNKLGLGGNDPHPNAAAGTYAYQTTFNISNHCIPSAQVNLSYIGGDNTLIGFHVNGYAYSITPGSTNDYSVLAQNVSFSVDPNHILLGANTITIYVNNSEAYTGFFACGNLSIGYCPKPAPGQNDETGMSDTKFNLEESFKVFPNPSTGQFSLKLAQHIEGHVDVIDLMGRKVWSAKLSVERSNYELDLTTLPKGIYNLSVQTGKTVQSRKIILE
jgi:hypothetical protein